MDKDAEVGETSTPRTHDRGEISDKPVGSAAEDDDATSERLINEQKIVAENDKE